MTARADLEVLERLDVADVDAVTWLVEAATEADGVRPLSEHVELHLRHGGERPGRHLLLREGEGGALAGYAHLDRTDVVSGPSAELVVRPDARRRGFGTALLRTLLAESGAARLRVWAHGSHPGAEALGRAQGFERTRELWQMGRELPYVGARVPLPAAVILRSFAPGLDDAEWVALNAEAFAKHPEQGRITLDDLHIRMKESWFDPHGFLVAERAGAMVGFAWTKVHGGAERPRLSLVGAAQTSHAHPPLGELYVLGVATTAQVRGLGRALTVAALDSMTDRGLDRAMLYVEADNAPATHLYSSLGFVRTGVDVMWRSPVPDAVAP